MRRLWVVLCAALYAVLFAFVLGCPREREVKVEVFPDQITLGPGGQFDFDAVQSGTFGESVTWSVIEGSYVGSIDENGTFTATDQVVPGQQITIRATSTLYGTVYGEARITIVLQIDPPAGPVGGGNQVRIQIQEPFTAPNQITRVSFGGVETTDIEIASDTAILARAPAAAATGYTDVTLIDDFDRTFTYTRGYKYRLNFLRLGGSAALPGPDGIRSVAVGDFDGDGELELAGGSDLGAIGLVDNPYTTPTLIVDGGIVPGPVDILRAGDVDGDGKDEIIAGYYDFGVVPGCFGAGLPACTGGIEIIQFEDGEFKDVPNAQFDVGDWEGAFGMEVGDVNGDGQDDIVFLQTPPNLAANEGQLIIAPSGGSTLIQPTLASNFNDNLIVAYSLAVADLDLDGTDEILIGYVGFGVGSTDGQPLVEVLSWNGTDYVQVDALTDPNAGPDFEEGAMKMTVGDFNGDDIPDLMTFPINYLYLSDGRVSWFAPGTGTAPDLLGPETTVDPLVSEPTFYLSFYANDLGVNACGQPNSVHNCPGPPFESSAFIGGIFTTNSNADDLNGDGMADVTLLVDLSGVGDAGDEGVMALINQGTSPPQFDLPEHVLLGGWYAPETVFRLFSPTRAVTADFDGDGVAELVYPRWSYRPELGRFQILDSRAFEATPPGRVDIGYPAKAFDIGDFNGDGDPDFVAIHTNCPGCTPTNFNQLGIPALSLQVFLSDGNGDWTAQTEVPIGAPDAPDELRDVHAADVDGDTNLDLIVAANTGVHILLGAGDGTFGAPGQALPPTTGAREVLVKDIDFDGIPDLVIAGDDTSIHILRTTKNAGSLVAYPAGEVDIVALGGNPSGLDAADVDGDSDIDIIVAGGGATGIAILRFDPKDNIDYRDEEIDLSVRPSKVVAADLDADGRAEIVMSDEPDVVSVMHVLPGVGVEHVDTIYTGLDDTENCPLFFPFATPKTQSLQLADMDLDGLLDLVVGYGAEDCVWVQSDIAVLTGVRGGTFDAPTQYYGVDLPLSVEASDYDADGKRDVGLLILRNGSEIYNTTMRSNIVLLTNTAD